MSEIPEALRLADDLKTVIRQEDAEDNVILVPRWTAEDSAAKLIRQHAEIERLKAERDESVRAEREACAAIAEMPKYLNETGILTVNPAKSAAAHFIAIAIRARGEVPR